LGDFPSPHGKGTGKEAQPVAAEGLQARILHAAHGFIEAVKEHLIVRIDGGGSQLGAVLKVRMLRPDGNKKPSLRGDATD